MDGLGVYYNWIRGFDFDKMIKNFYKLSEITDVKSSYFNYTISAFNFHRVPDFLDFFIKEKRKHSKLRRLSFSIAHPDYINFRVFDKNIRTKVKNNIQNKIKKLDIKYDGLDGLSAFFQELSLEKLDIKSVSKFKNWLSFCNKL